MPNNDGSESSIYSRLSNAPLFHPSVTDLFAEDWALEAGDVVTVKSGEDSYSVPIFTMDLEWKGGSRVTIESTGNEDPEPMSSGKRAKYRSDSNIYEALCLTKEKLSLKFEDDLNGLRSYLEMTASHLRTEFYNELDSLRSYVEITASHLRTEFYDDLNSLRSYVEITASHLRTEFYDDMNSLRSYVEITASHLQTQFYDDLNSLRSYVEITASHLQTEFYDDLNSLRSYVELTASHLQTEFIDDLNSLRSYVELTASHLEVEFSDEINSLRSYVDLTASNLRIEFEDETTSMRSEIAQNAYEISLKVSQGDVATELAVELGNVSITGGNLVVSGYVTTSELYTELASIETAIGSGVITEFLQADQGTITALTTYGLNVSGTGAIWVTKTIAGETIRYLGEY